MKIAATMPNLDTPRVCVITLVCACAALALGTFAALGAEHTVATVAIASIFCVAAWILPLNWVALALAALIPLQIYFPFAGGLNLRGAFVFVAAAVLRVLIARVIERDGRSALSSLRSLHWLFPAALFIVAAFISSLTAPNRYVALRGIYDWLPLFATAFVIGEIVQTERMVRQVSNVLIAIGVGEALLGLAQAILDLPRVLNFLRLPFNTLVYQPSLLHERLEGLSFNWILYDRVLPFGTFINNIDYAIFLAAVLSLALARLLNMRRSTASHTPDQGSRVTNYVLQIALIALFSVTLLQTLKGSGILALAGGVGTIGILSIRRMSPRGILLGALGAIVALAFAAPFYDMLAQRFLFVIQRELGALSGTGRLAIWAQLLAHVLERPWFGWGLHNGGLLTEPIPVLIGGAFAYQSAAPESAYVAVLVETGVIGFGALTLFIAVVLTRAYRVGSQSEFALGISAAIVAILFGSLTLVGLTTDQNGMWLGMLIGLVFSSTNHNERSRNPKS
jgi:O-antigen ligase